MKKMTLLLLCVALSVTVSARPRAVIFDTDWWTDVDDACALRLLHWAESKGLIEIKGICLSAVNATSVQSISSFMEYEGMKGIELGADKEATDFTGRPCYHDLIIQSVEGAAKRSLDDCDDAVNFYRKLLSRARGKIDIIAVGYPNALARLLESGPDSHSDLPGTELVKKKVRRLWMMAGKYPEGSENNFTRTERSRTAGHLVCSSWPTEIVFLGYEIGVQMQVGGCLPENDLLKKVLNIHGSSGGRYAWDPLTAYMACLDSPEEAGFDIVRGTNSEKKEDGSNVFYPDAKGRHSYVVYRKDPIEIKSAIDRILLEK